jgi:hypothetical protein
MIGLLLLLAVAIAVLGLRLIDLRYRWHWRQISLEARLRDAKVRADAFSRALARLRADRAAGRLAINDDYASLFERLTAEGAE